MRDQLSISARAKVLIYIVVILVVIITCYPIFWVVCSSIKTADEIAFRPPYTLPGSLFLGNYIKAITQSPLIRYFTNSVIVAACTLVLLVLVGSLAAFPISKMRFKQADGVMSYFLFGIMIPMFVCLVPMFQIYKVLGLRNTYASLVIPQIGFGLPICIYLYVGFMRYIPNSLCEAAMIDGASNLTIFTKLIFPMAKNSTITIVIFNFVNVWNEFTFANTFMTKSDMKTLPIGLNDFVGEMGSRDWGATFAAIVIAVLPTLIVYFFLNKSVMEGMAAGALKG